MILRFLSIILLILILISCFSLINVRYQYRVYNKQLAQLENMAYNLNKEFSKLQLEDATYTSNLVLFDLAVNKLGLIRPTKIENIDSNKKGR